MANKTMKLQAFSHQSKHCNEKIFDEVKRMNSSISTMNTGYKNLFNKTNEKKSQVARMRQSMLRLKLLNWTQNITNFSKRQIY